MIISAIGLSSGLLTKDVFAVAMIMTVASTLFTPWLLVLSLRSKRSSLRDVEKEPSSEMVSLEIEMPSDSAADLFRSRLVDFLRRRIFNVNVIDFVENVYHVYRGRFLHDSQSALEHLDYQLQIDAIFIWSKRCFWSCSPASTGFCGSSNLREKQRDPENHDDGRGATSGRKTFLAQSASADQSPMRSKAISRAGPRKKSWTNCFPSWSGGRLKEDKRQQARHDLLERERSMSTGLQNGIALPHCKPMRWTDCAWLWEFIARESTLPPWMANRPGFSF